MAHHLNGLVWSSDINTDINLCGRLDGFFLVKELSGK